MWVNLGHMLPEVRKKKGMEVKWEIDSGKELLLNWLREQKGAFLAETYLQNISQI